MRLNSEASVAGDQQDNPNYANYVLTLAPGSNSSTPTSPSSP